MADIVNLFSERALEEEDYRNKVILPTDYEFNQIKRWVDVFPELISLDYMPVKYLCEMGYIFGFPYLETEPPQVQRDIYRRLVEIYKQKGSRGLFELAIEYSHDPNYALGTMSYYHGDIESANYSLTYPREWMFRHDYTAYDRSRFADSNTYALGIIDVETDKFNSRVETYLDRLIPAGIKYKVIFDKNLVGDGKYGAVVYPFRAWDKDPKKEEKYRKYEHLILFEPPVPSVYVADISHIVDRRKDEYSVYDGHQVVTHSIEIESQIPGAMFLPVFASDKTYSANAVVKNFPKMTPRIADNWRKGNPVPSKVGGLV